MPPRRAIDVRQVDSGAAPKWRMSLLENTFTAFLQSPCAADAAAKAMFAEGSLFSPYLFGKFFDPADAFPLWEFESDVLLAALRRGCRTTVDWTETDSEYYLRADIPGTHARSQLDRLIVPMSIFCSLFPPVLFSCSVTVNSVTKVQRCILMHESETTISC
jgi:hypothetical protein